MSVKRLILKATRNNALTLLLAVSVLINIAQFPFINKAASNRYKALHRYGTSDITKIGQKESSQFLHEYGLFMALGRKYPASVIVVPKKQKGKTYTANLLSFGRAARIKWAEYEETLPPQFDYAPFIVASGSGGERATRPKEFGRKPRTSRSWDPFVIAARTKSPRFFLLGKRGSTVVLVDAALLPRELWDKAKELNR